MKLITEIDEQIEDPKDYSHIKMLFWELNTIQHKVEEETDEWPSMEIDIYCDNISLVSNSIYHRHQVDRQLWPSRWSKIR